MCQADAARSTIDVDLRTKDVEIEQMSKGRWVVSGRGVAEGRPSLSGHWLKERLGGMLGAVLQVVLRALLLHVFGLSERW